MIIKNWPSEPGCSHKVQDSNWDSRSYLQMDKLLTAESAGLGLEAMDGPLAKKVRVWGLHCWKVGSQHRKKEGALLCPLRPWSDPFRFNHILICLTLVFTRPSLRSHYRLNYLHVNA